MATERCVSAGSGGAGWAWLDGADIPLGEEAEGYRLVIAPSTGASRTIDISSPSYDYGPSEQMIDGSAAASSVTISVTQSGSLASSFPAAVATFSL